MTPSASTGSPSHSGTINTLGASAHDYTEPILARISAMLSGLLVTCGQQRDRADAELQAHRQAMRECCESIEVLYELEMTDDWLQQEVFGGAT